VRRDEPLGTGAAAAGGRLQFGRAQELDGGDRAGIAVEPHVEIAGAEVLDWTSLAVDDLHVDQDALDPRLERRLLLLRVDGRRRRG
jgi:hypothetical protein